MSEQSRKESGGKSRTVRLQSEMHHRTHESEDDQDQRAQIEGLRQMMSKMSKRIDDLNEENENLKTQFYDHAQTLQRTDSVGTGTGRNQTTQAAKGKVAVGMTSEQLTEFKKLTLYVNSLAERLKEQEVKLGEASGEIEKNAYTITGNSEKVDNMNIDFIKMIEDVNLSLSKKVAGQRVELQKLRGDEVKPVNYDPFNYGEAYSGDPVDFQARQRVLELRCVVRGLSAAVEELRREVKVNPKVDLGYTVVRMDELLAASALHAQRQAGAVGSDDVLTIFPLEERQPGKVAYPRREMFSSDEPTSAWAVTDAMMQTLYRLERELGELQHTVQASDVTATQRNIEDLQKKISLLVESKADVKKLPKMIEEAIIKSADGRPATHHRRTSEGAALHHQPHEAGISRDKLAQALAPLYNALEVTAGRLARLEAGGVAAPAALGLRHAPPTPHHQHTEDMSCFSCDRPATMQNFKKVNRPKIAAKA